MKLLRVHHIAIICSDYTLSKEFYVGKLGLKILNEVYRKERNSYKLDLAVGDNYQIELFSFDNPPLRPSYPEARGLRHLAFEVNNVEAAAQELLLKNVACEPILLDRITGKKYFFFHDPDGLPLEIYEK